MSQVKSVVPKGFKNVEVEVSNKLPDYQSIEEFDNRSYIVGKYKIQYNLIIGRYLIKKYLI